MPEVHQVGIKVISQKGTCHAGHKVGDEWVIGSKTPEGICMGAFHTIYPTLFSMIIGAPMWGPDPGVIKLACADSDNPVVFELRRLPK